MNLDPFHPPQQLMDSFCRESNKIEGECTDKTKDVGMLYPNDIASLRMVISYAASNKPLTENILLSLHKKVGGHLNKPWVGKYRDCYVTVGGGVPPAPGLVKHLMDNYILDWDTLNAWEAHVKFEKIHPFQDLNGRTGRLLWAWKALQEGWDWELSFLHMFYYQTLQNSRI